MSEQRSRPVRLKFSIFLAATLVVGCHVKVATVLTDVDRLESELQPGVTTKIDVRQALGDPAGFGGAVFAIDPRPHEVWCYQEIKQGMWFADFGLRRLMLQQQVLLVFFDQGMFDGFMWWSDTGGSQWIPGVVQKPDVGNPGDRFPGALSVPTVKYGWWPPTDHLEALRTDESSIADVLLALGEPRGRGVMRLSPAEMPQTILFYEDPHAVGGRVEQRTLLVFIHKDRYHGHLWFSCSAEV